MSLAWVAVAALLVPQSGAQFHGDLGTVVALSFSDSGRLLAASRGGLVSYGAHGAVSFGWNGLISGRGLDDIWVRGQKIWGSSGDTVGAWDLTRWVADPSAKPRPAEPVSMGLNGLVVPDRPVWPAGLTGAFTPPPGCRGTHVSAVAGDSRRLFAAWYDDGLWVEQDSKWQKLRGKQFQHVRCLAVHGNDLAVATYDGAVWWKQGERWHAMAAPNGPRGSVYSFGVYRGRVAAGTFEDGLDWFDGRRWSSIRKPVITSDNPREMAVFRGVLYVRHSTGEIDRFDGRRWMRSLLPWLLRGEATCLASGTGRLLVGQFGGWSEYDGARWAHFLRIPELQGLVVTALAARPGEVWVGTQERGVMRYDRKTGKIVAYDQRSGLGDDWVRRILLDRQEVVGMFLSGAYVKHGELFERLIPGIPAEATGLARDPAGRLIVGSRIGLWRVDGAQASRVPIAGLDSLEIQALMGTPTGLWLGMPNGAAFVPWDLLSPSS